MHYFQERFADLRVFSATPSMQQACRELSAARLNRDLAGERNLRERTNPICSMLLNQYGYSGLYLVDGTTGSVLLSSEKGRTTAGSAEEPAAA